MGAGWALQRLGGGRYAIDPVRCCVACCWRWNWPAPGLRVGLVTYRLRSAPSTSAAALTIADATLPAPAPGEVLKVPVRCDHLFRTH